MHRHAETVLAAQLFQQPAKAVGRILSARRHARLRLDDLARLTASPRRAAAFIVTADHRAAGLDRLDLRSRLVRPPEQLSLFA